MGDAESGGNKEWIKFDQEWCRDMLRLVGAQERPTVEELNLLLQVLYHASLETEEGRYPKLAAMWLGSESLAAKRLNILKFDKPQKLHDLKSRRPRTDLLKAAAICESETVFLLVEPSQHDQDDLQLLAWGFVDIRGHVVSCAKKVRERLDISQYPDVLTVHFERPGRFSIRQRGKFTGKYPEADSAEPVELWELAKRLFSAESESVQAQIYLLELVIGRLAASGRGGTLLFYGSKDSQHEYLNGGTKVEVRIGGQVYELVGGDGGNSFSPKAPYRFRELAQLMSEIASVDGATVVAPNLDIVRYGAKIARKKPIDKNKMYESETREWLIARGTRHGSAAEWVAAKEGLFAVVVSADGDANAIFWKGGEVRRCPVVYRRL